MVQDVHSEDSPFTACDTSLGWTWLSYHNIHLLCLPSHTSHILQPLDVRVFKCLKSFFSKGCRQYMVKNPGCVITEDVLASVVGSAIAQSHTPLNIL